jgi:hypothetical protein
MGCEETRRSTSGCTICVGGSLVYAASNAQFGLPAMSSGEAELRAGTSCAMENMCVKNLMTDMLIELEGVPKLWLDSKAAVGTANRLGPGKMRHLQARELILLEMTQEKLVDVGHVKATKNPADLMTKHLRHDIVAACLNMFGLMDMLEAMLGKTSGRKTVSTNIWNQPKMLSAIFTLGLHVMQIKEDGDDDVKATTDDNDEQHNWIIFGLAMFITLGFWILVVMLLRERCRRMLAAPTTTANVEVQVDLAGNIPPPVPAPPTASASTSTAAPAPSLPEAARVTSEGECYHRRAECFGILRATADTW